MATPQTSSQPQRSVADVMQDIVANVQQIIRSEFRLARVELKEKAEWASKPSAIMGAGAVLGLYGMGFLLLAALYGLSLVMAPWLAALLVGGVLTIISLILVALSRSQLKQIDPIPEKTIRTVKENVLWAKEQIK
jgi:membrane protein